MTDMPPKPNDMYDRPIGLGGGNHFGMQSEAAAMIFADCIALGLSASMTLTACATVFKWEMVRKSANHATMWMIFLSLGLWSLCKLAQTFLTFGSEDRGPPKPGQPPPINRIQMRYVTVAGEVLFNATSLWWILATYEFQRWIWRPRIHSRHVMLLYNIFVQVICISQFVAVIALDLTSPPPPPPPMGGPLGPPGGPGGRPDRPPNGPPGGPPGGPRPGGRKPLPPVVQLMETLFWVGYFIRWVAVVYPVVIGMILAHTQKRSTLQRSKSVQLFVGLLILLNVPSLVLEPLFDFGVFDKATMLLSYSFAKWLSYCIGIGMSFVLGLYLNDFDTLYTPTKKQREQTQVGDAFVVFDANYNGH